MEERVVGGPKRAAMSPKPLDVTVTPGGMSARARASMRAARAMKSSAVVFSTRTRPRE